MSSNNDRVKALKDRIEYLESFKEPVKLALLITLCVAVVVAIISTVCACRLCQQAAVSYPRAVKMVSLESGRAAKEQKFLRNQ